MLKIIAIVAAVLAVLLVAALAYPATQSNTFRVVRSARIAAPPEKIFPLVEDFRQWGRWSPYEQVDPDMARTFSGAQRGPGSVYEWDGDANIGQGRMEIIEASPSKITIKLDFIKPLEAYNTAEFTFEPQGETTQVTWAMHGPSPYLTKLIRTYMNLDGMIGRQFEQGLSNLGTIAEK